MSKILIFISLFAITWIPGCPKWCCCGNSAKTSAPLRDLPEVDDNDSIVASPETPKDLLGGYFFEYSGPESVADALNNFFEKRCQRFIFDEKQYIKFVDFGSEVGFIFVRGSPHGKVFYKILDKDGNSLSDDGNPELKSWESARDLIKNKSMLQAKIQKVNRKFTSWDIPAIQDQFDRDFSKICALRNFYHIDDGIYGLGIIMFIKHRETPEKIIDRCKEKLQFVAEGKLDPGLDSAFEDEYDCKYREKDDKGNIKKSFVSIRNLCSSVFPVFVDGKFTLAGLTNDRNAGKIAFVNAKFKRVNSLKESIASFEEHFDPEAMNELIAQAKKQAEEMFRYSLQ